MSKSDLMLTDSGGDEEEGPSYFRDAYFGDAWRD